MTILEAFEAGRTLEMGLTGDAHRRRITLVILRRGDVLAFDGQETDPFDTRHPVVLNDARGEGPTWTCGFITVYDMGLRV